MAAIAEKIYGSINQPRWIPLFQTFVSLDAQISPGCIVRAKATANWYVRLGEGTVTNLGVLIDHHCEIGAFSYIMMGAVIRGNAVIGKQSWVKANEVVEGEPAPM